MQRLDTQRLLDDGRRAAAKATSAQGEYAAWDAVVAQHIDVLSDGKPQRLPRWIAKRMQLDARKEQPSTRLDPPVPQPTDVGQRTPVSPFRPTGPVLPE